MPLKIRLKPEDKVYAGGAVLKNVGNKAADLLILSDGPVLRDGYMMNIDNRDDSDVSQVYFLLQIIYLFRGKGEKMDELVVSTLDSFAKLYPAFADDVKQITNHLEAGEAFKALRIGHDLMRKLHEANNGTSLHQSQA